MCGANNQSKCLLNNIRLMIALGRHRRTHSTTKMGNQAESISKMMGAFKNDRFKSKKRRRDRIKCMRRVIFNANCLTILKYTIIESNSFDGYLLGNGKKSVGAPRCEFIRKQNFLAKTSIVHATHVEFNGMWHQIRTF